MSDVYDQTDGYELYEEYEIVIYPRSYSRGRSAIIHWFADEKGRRLAFGPAGIQKLFEQIISGRIELTKSGGFNGVYRQGKRGQNARWSPV